MCCCVNARSVQAPACVLSCCRLTLELPQFGRLAYDLHLPQDNVTLSAVEDAFYLLADRQPCQLLAAEAEAARAAPVVPQEELPEAAGTRQQQAAGLLGRLPVGARVPATGLEMRRGFRWRRQRSLFCLSSFQRRWSGWPACVTGGVDGLGWVSLVCVKS